MEIKEEVKEEPLTLGPDDPLSIEDEDDDDDFSNWGKEDYETYDTLPGETPVRPKTPDGHMVIMPASVCMSLQKTKGKASNDLTLGGSGAPPNRSSHVLPQMISRPIGSVSSFRWFVFYSVIALCTGLFTLLLLYS